MLTPMASAPAATGFWSRRGVRARSTIAAVAVVALALLIGGAVLLSVLTVTLTNGVRASVEQRVVDVVAQVEGNRVEEATTTVNAAPGDATVVQIVAADGTVALSSAAIQGEQPIVSEAPTSTTVSSVRVELPFVDDDPYLVAAVDTSTREGPVTVISAQSLVPVQRVIGLVFLLLAVGSPFLLVAVGVITWLAVGRSLRSVDRIRARVETIGDRQLHARVPVPVARDEIAGLAITMNGMLDRLEASATAQRQFVADASHELRSPLASMRASLDVAHSVGGAQAWADAQPVLSDEVERMTRLVGDLLLLAKVDEGALTLRAVDVDLDDLVSDEARRLRAQTSLSVTTRIEAVRFTGDPDRLAQALRNLVDNAARFARTQIRLGVSLADGTAWVVVEDDGPGIRAQDRQAVLTRFVRLDEHRSRDQGGAGLGLAITDEIARLHGGRCVVGDSDLGGAQVSLRLPATVAGAVTGSRR